MRESESLSAIAQFRQRLRLGARSFNAGTVVWGHRVVSLAICSEKDQNNVTSASAVRMKRSKRLWHESFVFFTSSRSLYGCNAAAKHATPAPHAGPNLQGDIPTRPAGAFERAKYYEAARNT